MTRNSRNLPLFFFIFILLLVLGLNAVMIAPYALALFMGTILAVLLRPLYVMACRRKIPPKLSAALVVGVLLLVLVGPFTALLTMGINQAVALVTHLTQEREFSFGAFVDILDRWTPMKSVFGDREVIERNVRLAIQNGGRALTTKLLGILGALPDLVLQLFLALITCFFLLLDGKRLLTWVRERLPLDKDVQTLIAKVYADTSVSVIWSTLAAAAAQASVMFVSFVALRVPGAVLATGATFLFAWIPIVGSTPVWVGAAIYLYTQDAWVRMGLMIVAGLLTGGVDNVVRPMVLKGRGDIHPLVSLVAIFGGVQLFGIFGVFFGPIFVSMLLALLEIWPAVWGRSRV